jgi:outer membrane protein assembly factor BamB
MYMHAQTFGRRRGPVLMPVFCGVVALLTAFAASGCRSKGEGSALRPPPGTSSFPVVHEDWARVGYRLDWVGFPFPSADAKTQVTFLNAYDDIVVAMERGSTVSVVESSTGEARWASELANPLTKFVGVNRDPINPGQLIVSSESEVFTLAAATGTLIGRERLSRVVNTTPVIEGNIAIYGTSSGEVIGQVLGRGVKAWGFATTGAIEADPVPISGYIAAVSQAGDVMFLNPNGSLVGRARVYEGIDNDPVADGGLLYIAGRDRSVWAFDVSGQLMWQHRTSTPLRAQPTVHAGTLYVDIPGNGLTAFEGATGKVLWKSPNANGTVIGMRGGRLLVHKDRTLLLVDAAGGDVQERISIPNVVRLTTDAFVDGRLYAVSDRAVLAKFQPR